MENRRIVIWLRLPDIHCKAPTWWQEFGIHLVRESGKRIIKLGSPPVRPKKTYECPLHEARRYERLLSDPFINSQADIARELGITRARVSQVMGLLKLPEEIQRVLLGLDDQKAIRYFSERRLRPLLALRDPARQVREFNRMLEKVQPISQKRIDKNKAECYHYDSIVVGG